MIVLWSGGCDSTLALYRALKDEPIPRKDGVQQYPSVRALSVRFPRVPRPVESARARKKLVTEFAKRKLYFQHTELTINEESFGHQFYASESRPFPIQPQMWMLAAHIYAEPNEDVAFGWIGGELDRFELVNSTWENLQQLGGKTGKLLFPLRWQKKYGVIKQLRDAKLLDLCWFCEDWGEKRIRSIPCGVCRPCVENKTARWQLEHFSHDALFEKHE